MAPATIERRLVAILAADIVGYSRLMEADEAATLSSIRALRSEVIDPTIAEHHGRIIKLMGDGAIVEFGSVVDAVSAAVAIQNRTAEHEKKAAPTRRIVFRIGINLGDVVVEGDDLFGDGVNIAARLEQLCDPGGIMVSGTAYDHLQGKLGLPLEEAGEQKVKNIARPVRTYRVRLDGSKRSWRPALRRIRRRLSAATGLLAALMLAAGIWWWFRPSDPISNEPSIAVLPFANGSGDPSQDYFGHGVAGDLITVLSTFPAIRVVSSMSSFVYEKPTKVQDVARDLGVRYVLEGSALKEADKARVTARLIDGSTGLDVWADKFEAEGGDVATLQEDVADKIYNTVAGIGGKVRQDEERQAWRKSAPSLTEYDCYLRANKLLETNVPEDSLRARGIIQECLERFPSSILLKTKLGWTYMIQVTNGWSSDPKQDAADAWRIVSNLTDVERESRFETWLHRWLLAYAYAYHMRDFERAANEAEATVQLVPYDSRSRSSLSFLVANAGRVNEAIAWNTEIFRREPHPSPWMHLNRGWAYYLAGRYEEALAANKQANGIWLPNDAAIYVRLGRLDDARAAIARFAKEMPAWKLQDEAWATPSTDTIVLPYLADLRAAGMPER